jgi:hypothetical protein
MSGTVWRGFESMSAQRAASTWLPYQPHPSLEKTLVIALHQPRRLPSLTAMLFHQLLQVVLALI